MTEASKSNLSDLVTQHYSYWALSPSWLGFLFGSLECQRQKSQSRGRNYEQVQARYKFPGLFSTNVLDIVGQRSLSDWSVNFRTYRIIPYDAPIFEAIEYGDILRVQSLL